MAERRRGRGWRLFVLALGLVMQLGNGSTPWAQVSPGPLSRAHRDFDSALLCFRCHGGGDDRMDQNCLDCHAGVDWLVKRDLGLHGHEVQQECASCHPEHGGLDFDIQGFERDKQEGFDHDRTGWPLDGQHAAIECKDCHKPEFQTSPAARLLQRARISESWIGLERECITCHVDYHQGTLEPTCEDCHTTRKWVPAAIFDHERTQYPLRGGHIDVPCNDCHLAAHLDLVPDEKGEPTPLYRPLEYRECTPCHADPHLGALGPECASCHVVQSWFEVDRKGFNHDQTRYPLRGGHRGLECASCHDPVKAWGPKPAFARCGDCHVDPHAGKATLDGAAVDCMSCHRVEAWSPSTYGVEDHQSSSYPLEGKHAEVECGECHPKNPAGVSRATLGTAGVWLRPPYAACIDCHHDAHDGQLAPRPDAGACEGCHLVTGWKPSTYDAQRHAELRLDLQGRHLELACSECHGPIRASSLRALPDPATLGDAKVLLTLHEFECRHCHIDPHGGRFEPNGDRPKEARCAGCHEFRQFRPSVVDVALHADFNYTLEGAHRATPCIDCHKELEAEPLGNNLILTPATPPELTFLAEHERCESCHLNPHGTQFHHRADSGTCEGCHDLEQFAPAVGFDHDHDSIFPLEGAHAAVACAECHPTRITDEGAEQVVYRPIPTTCETCHGGKAPGPLVSLRLDLRGKR